MFFFVFGAEEYRKSKQETHLFEMRFSAILNKNENGTLSSRHLHSKILTFYCFALFCRNGWPSYHQRLIVCSLLVTDLLILVPYFLCK